MTSYPISCYYVSPKIMPALFTPASNTLRFWLNAQTTQKTKTFKVVQPCESKVPKVSTKEPMFASRPTTKMRHFRGRQVTFSFTLGI